MGEVRFILGRAEWDYLSGEDRSLLEDPSRSNRPVDRVRWEVARSTAFSEPVSARGLRGVALSNAAAYLFNEAQVEFAYMDADARRCRVCGCVDEIACDGGCGLESPGCTHCYAMRVARRFGGKGQPYEGLTRGRVHLGPVWTGEVREIPTSTGWRAP